MASKTIVILGGGIGGVAAANKLRHLLKEDRIIVVDQSPAHSFTGISNHLSTFMRRNIKKEVVRYIFTTF